MILEEKSHHSQKSDPGYKSPYSRKLDLNLPHSREKLDLLISRIAEILKDEILKSGIRRKEGETELRILVQSSQAGAIIGTKGTTVKTLREVGLIFRKKNY